MSLGACSPSIKSQSKPAVAQISAVYGLASASHIPIWVRFSRSARLKGLALESVMRRGGFAGRGAGASSGQEFAVPSRTKTQERDAVQTQPMPLYHTIVHNCDCHTFEDVIFGLMRIVGTGLRDAGQKATENDTFGRGTGASTTLELAELYAQRLHNEGGSASGTLLG